MLFDKAGKSVPGKRKISELEDRFATVWDALGGPELVREYRFDKTRRWRADFAWETARVLVEVEGGVWNRGRHLTPGGFIKDAEKYLEATLKGWAVVRLVDSQLTPGVLKRILDYGRERERILGEPVA